MGVEVQTYDRKANQSQRCFVLKNWITGYLGDDYERHLNFTKFLPVNKIFKPVKATDLLLANKIFEPVFGDIYKDLSDKERESIRDDFASCDQFSAAVKHRFSNMFVEKGRGYGIYHWLEMASKVNAGIEAFEKQEAFEALTNAPSNFKAQGEKIYENSLLSVYKHWAHPTQEKTCQPEFRYFKVSVDYKVGLDHVFTRKFLHETLFKNILMELANIHCPNPNQISANVFVKGVQMNYSGEDMSGKQAPEDNTGGLSLVYAAIAPPFEMPITADRIYIQYTGHDFAGRSERYDEYINEVASINALKAYRARGDKTLASIERENAKLDAYQALRDKYNWPTGVSTFSSVYLDYYEGIRDYSKLYHSDQFQFRYAIVTYVHLSSEKCGRKQPHGATQLVWNETATRKNSAGQVIESKYGKSAPILIDNLMLDLYRIVFRQTTIYQGPEYVRKNIFHKPEEHLTMVIRRDLHPLFEKWECGGPEFKRLNENIVKFASR